MTRYAVGFEVAGLLLTAALVGAIALAHREEEEPGSGAGLTQPTRQPPPGTWLRGGVTIRANALAAGHGCR